MQERNNIPDGTAYVGSQRLSATPPVSNLTLRFSKSIPKDQSYNKMQGMRNSTDRSQQSLFILHSKKIHCCVPNIDYAIQTDIETLRVRFVYVNVSNGIPGERLYPENHPLLNSQHPLRHEKKHRSHRNNCCACKKSIDATEISIAAYKSTLLFPNYPLQDHIMLLQLKFLSRTTTSPIYYSDYGCTEGTHAFRPSIR